MERRLLFKVAMGVGGHEYVIYDNGEIEGFGEGAIIFNYHSVLMGEAIARTYLEKGISIAPECPTTQEASDRFGAAHSTPL